MSEEIKLILHCTKEAGFSEDMALFIIGLQSLIDDGMTVEEYKELTETKTCQKN
jgi:hypothetical protein